MTTQTHTEREYKFATDVPAKQMYAMLTARGDDSAAIVHVYTNSYTRFGRRVDMSVEPMYRSPEYVRDVKGGRAVGDDGSVTRAEARTTIGPAEFHNVALKALQGEHPYLVKDRFLVPFLILPHLTIEVDVYTYPPDAPVVIEVEVPEGHPPVEATDLPSWLGRLRGVSDNPRYYAAGIARRVVTA